MKTYLRLAGAVAVCCFICQAGQAFASSFDAFSVPTCSGGICTATADDTIIAFPGQENSDPTIGDTYPHSYSIPNITKVTITWDEATNTLQTLAITAPTSFQWWNSLFLNTDYTGVESDIEKWNYFVHLGGADTNHYAVDKNGNPATVPGDGVYKVADDYNYTYVSPGHGRMQEDGTGHANGIADDGALTPLGAANVNLADPPFNIVYDFASLGITLGENFAIGYTPWCANDVVLMAGSRDSGSGAVPEPATVMLFGLGIAGLAGWRIRRTVVKK